MPQVQGPYLRRYTRVLYQKAARLRLDARRSCVGTCHITVAASRTLPISITLLNIYKLLAAVPVCISRLPRGDVTAYWMDHGATCGTSARHLKLCHSTCYMPQERRILGFGDNPTMYSSPNLPQPFLSCPISIFIIISLQGRTMKFMYFAQSLVCIPFFHASLVFTTPLTSLTQPALIQYNTSRTASSALG